MQTEIGCPQCRTHMSFQDQRDGRYRYLACPDRDRCGYRINYATAVHPGDEARMEEIRRDMALTAARYEEALSRRTRGPAIPAGLRSGMDLNGARVLALNASEHDRIASAMAQAAGRAVGRELLDRLPHVRVETRFARPAQDSDLWCLPRLTWFGEVDPPTLADVERAANEGIAGAFVIWPAITPAEFHAL